MQFLCCFAESPSLAIAIALSALLSVGLMIVVTFMLLWRKKSKQRGNNNHSISSVAPESIKEGRHSKSRNFSESSLSSSLGRSSTNTAETTWTNKDEKSTVTSDNYCDSRRFKNDVLEKGTSSAISKEETVEIDGCINYGYLSETTSGYNSENSSARSSATHFSRLSKRFAFLFPFVDDAMLCLIST